MKKKLIMLASLLLVANQVIAEPLLEKEVLIFTNGQYIKGKNKKVREVNFKNWNNENKEEVNPEPPIEPPVDPPVNPEPPIEPPVKDWTLISTHEIYKNKIDELIVNGVELVKHGGKLYALDRENKNAYEIREKAVTIWEEGNNIFAEDYTTVKDLIGTSTNSALKALSGKIINNHLITVNTGESSFKVAKGIELSGATGENNGIITVTGENAIGVLATNNSNFINKNLITVDSNNSRGIEIKNNSKGENQGEVRVSGKGTIGISVMNSSNFENKNKVYVTGGEKEMLEKNTIGLGVSTNSIGVNTGEIFVTGKNVAGALVGSEGTFINKNLIQVDNSINIGMFEEKATALTVVTNATAKNEGRIEINGNNAIGVKVATDGEFTNDGVINLNGNDNIGVELSTGGKLTNNGQIVIKAGTTGNRELVNNGGTILNKGLIKSNDVFEIDSRGIFEIGKNGAIEAKEVIGNIKLNNDLTFNNYSDVISEEILKTENYQGVIISDSILYDSTTVKTENGYAVNLERKEFTEILENQGLANYLESNYTNGTPKKDKLFNELKLSKNENSLNNKINNVFGNNIFPNLKKQTLDLINHTKETLIKNVFKSKATKEIRTIAGYDYKKNEVKSSENLSGYDETVNSIFLGMDKGITQNLRVGGVLTLGELNSNYTLQNVNRKGSNLQANIFTQYEKNGLNYVFNGFIGGTNGELKRKVQLETINSKLSTNLESRYIGFNNIVSKKINKNGFILEPQFQVNATYLKMNGLDESGEFGIKTSKENVKSFEVGTGVTLERSFATNKYVITPKLGANYFYEFGSPYRAFDGQMLDISTDKFEISKNSIDRGRTELFLGVDVEKGNLKIYGDYRYLVEREENLLSAGLIYKFN